MKIAFKSIEEFDAMRFRLEVKMLKESVLSRPPSETTLILESYSKALRKRGYNFVYFYRILDQAGIELREAAVRRKVEAEYAAKAK